MRALVASISPAWVITACALCVGCNGETEVIQQAGRSHLATLAAAHNKYQVAHRGQVPPNEATFREFLAGHESLANWLEAAGVSSIDELFVSERDDQPYVLLFGKDTNKYTPAVMGYEQRGVGGQRVVGYCGGFVKVLADAEFNELIGQP